MAKKSKKNVPTKEDIQRLNMIKEYNRNNTVTQILRRKVTEEDIKELETRLDDIRDKRNQMTYLIADVNNAARVHDFLVDFNLNHALWTRDLWKGVLQFDNFLKEWKAKYENEPTDLVFDFPALSFCYNMLMNPGGVGLATAQWMSDNDEQYNAVLNVMGEYIDDFQKENELFTTLNECLAARYQGFMMVLADEVKGNDVAPDVETVETDNTTTETVEENTHED